MSSPDERPDAADSPEAKGADELSLAPIPAEGTAAPPDAERVFARPPASSPYARIVTAASVHTPGPGSATPTEGSRAASGEVGAHGAAVHSESTGGEPRGGSGGTAGDSSGSGSSGSGSSGSGSSGGGRSNDGGGDAGGHNDGPDHRDRHNPTRGGSEGHGQTPGASTGGPGTPHRAPAAPPSEDELKHIRNRGRLAILFGLTGLVASVLAFPLGLILGIAAIVCGVLSRRAARRHRVLVPGATPGLVLGVVATLFASILTATAVVFWDEVVEYQQCFSGANTQTARDSCQQRLEERILDRVGPLNAPR